MEIRGARLGRAWEGVKAAGVPSAQILSGAAQSGSVTPCEEKVNRKVRGNLADEMQGWRGSAVGAI
jgi:hypothetical protein